MTWTCPSCHHTLIKEKILQNYQLACRSDQCWNHSWIEFDNDNVIAYNLFIKSYEIFSDQYSSELKPTTTLYHAPRPGVKYKSILDFPAFIPLFSQDDLDHILERLLKLKAFS